MIFLGENCKMTFENWWEDLELMRRLFRYDSETGLIYAKDRSEEDFYDTGEGSSFVSAAGAAGQVQQRTQWQAGYEPQGKD